MAKDKKGKSESKKLALAAKKAKQEKKGEKVKGKQSKKFEDSDDDDVDLDQVLADMAKQQAAFLQVHEVTCEPPRARASSTLIASPSSDNEIFLFGGEYFNGALATFFNDFFVYLCNKDEWRSITSPNSPLPRSGHAWCRGGNAGGLFLFGGEFSSPKQGTFYHYNDFWHFDCSSREWECIETKGKSPPSRSGHRMTFYKNYIILFGGFQDTAANTKYLNDLWIYDTSSFLWHQPVLPLASPKPDPRSSFSFLPHESGAILYGGYARVKAIQTGKQMKGGGQSQRTILKPMVYEDCFFLRITQPNAHGANGLLPVVRWERRKKPANAPTPSRAGATMVWHKGRGIQFGGVHDVEESEEGIASEFFNTLFTWNIERNRFFPLSLRKPRTGQRKTQGNQRGGRRGRGQADKEELLRNLAALETGKSIAEDNDIEIERPDEDEETMLPSKEILLEFPHPRFNAQLAVQGDQLFIYGGTFEKGDREYTFDEMYSIDLGKMDGVKQIFRREPDNWLGSDEEASDEDDSEDGDSIEEEDDDEEMPDAKPFHTESKRKSKAKAQVDSMDDTTESVPSPVASTFDDTPEDSSSTTTDNLPVPRPFESRRDFFQRTGNQWQEELMTALRWKGIQPESLAIKEIKTKAFEMSESRWWDLREEVIALEEEQDAAGIGEQVSLADKEANSGGGRRR